MIKVKNIFVVLSVIIFIALFMFYSDTIPETKMLCYKTKHTAKMPVLAKPHPRLSNMNPVNFIPFETELIDMYQEEDLPHIWTKDGRDIQEIIQEDIKENRKSGRDVHDSYIQKKLSEDMKSDKTDTKTDTKTTIKDTIPVDERLNTMLYYCKNDKELETVIKKIFKRDTKMIMYDDKTEADIFWEVFRDGNTNVKNQLMLECRALAREGLYCPTGNVSRFLECKYIERPHDLPIDKGTLQKKMLQECSEIMATNPEMTHSEIVNSVREKYIKIYSEKLIDGITKDWTSV